MPWHYPQDRASNSRLTPTIQKTFDAFDKGLIKPEEHGLLTTKVPEYSGGYATRQVHPELEATMRVRRAALQKLGAGEKYAHLSATWVKNESAAMKHVFHRFDFNGNDAIDSNELGPALELLGIDTKAEAVAAKIRRISSIDLPTFQKLVATLRRLQREAPPPKVRPKSASAGSATQAALRPKGDLMSSDDGGAPAPPKQVDEEEMGGGSQVVPKRKFKRTTPIDLEIDHVRRQLMGRAMTLGRTTNGVVYEHQVYHEGLQRALDGQKAEWQLHLLHNRDVAKQRGISRSHWRPATAGPSHKPQPNINPYEKTLPGSKKTSYTPIDIEKWVQMVERLQMPYNGKRR